MPYEREVSQVHNTIVAAGNSKTAVVYYKTLADPMSGLGGVELTLTVFFAQVSYSSKDIADDSIADGLIKVLISPLDAAGVPIVDFVSIMTNKSAYVALNGRPRISVKLVKITKPDGSTPVVARVYLGG